MKKNTIITMVVCALLIAATIGGLVWYDKAEKAKADGATGTGGSSSSSTPRSEERRVGKECFQ